MSDALLTPAPKKTSVAPFVIAALCVVVVLLALALKSTMSERNALITNNLTQVNQAIAKKPNDPVLHEFRALILFATKEYKASAAVVYAVLSMGPGWDWATLSWSPLSRTSRR